MSKLKPSLNVHVVEIENKISKYKMERCKKNYTEAVNYGKKIPITRTSFHYLGANLYRLSLACEWENMMQLYSIYTKQSVLPWLVVHIEIE